MLIFIDDKFSKEIIKIDHNHKIVEDFITQIFIKSKGYNLVTSLTELEVENLLVKIQDPIIRLLIDDCKSIEYETSINKVVNDDSSIHKILLVNNSITKINNTSIEYFNSQNIKDKWIKYSTLRTDYSLPTSNDYDLDPEERFSDWNNLSRWNHPISDIYIYDKYLLVDTKNQSIKNNLIPMLSQLGTFSDNEVKIKIFTLEENICTDHKNKSKTYPFEKNTDKKIKYIFDQFKKQFDNINLSICVISYKALCENRDDFFWLEHDRMLMTNYYLIERGQGFNIFNKDFDILDGSKITFDYLFHRSNYANFFLRRKYIDKLIHLSDSEPNYVSNYSF
ncbi:hypothetical protein N9I98_01065 [Flavobacteriales bacterium]|nr:hypothetical protein [Flavobacteriales bacterium]